ncbi:hypothetical protein PFISCL1PPCAC_11065, partial [Pristionchus fissidentatus]
MGMDVCRACTVFYRRSKGKSYVCRSKRHKCGIRDECRKCRYDRLERMLKNKESAIDEKESPEEYVNNNVNRHEEQIRDNCHLDTAQPSCSTARGASISSFNRGTPLISKLERKYRTMCETRLTSELSSRSDPPHPLRVNYDNYPIYPATYDSVNRANRTFLAALLQFGSAMFPEFSRFKECDKWTIVTNFFTHFRTFESAYRANKIYPHDMEIGLQGYTLYFAEDVVGRFFDDCPNIGDNEEAKRVIRARFKSNLGPHRESVKRFNHRHEEFLASLALMFWSTEGLDVSEEVVNASEQYKEMIMRELHNYYREELRMEDYAIRLGEVLLFLQTYEQRAGDMDKHLEVLRLLNVFSEET